MFLDTHIFATISILFADKRLYSVGTGSEKNCMQPKLLRFLGFVCLLGDFWVGHCLQVAIFSP